MTATATRTYEPESHQARRERLDDRTCRWNCAETMARADDESLAAPPPVEESIDQEDDDDEGTAYVRTLRNGQIVPDVDEIAAECRAIRREWSNRETLRRQGLDPDEAGRWNVPTARAVIDTGELCE
jgi:hypothetical protein